MRRPPPPTPLATVARAAAALAAAGRALTRVPVAKAPAHLAAAPLPAPPARLGRLYATAVAHEAAFFDAAGARPLNRRLRALVVDFDDTLTVRDSTRDVIGAALAAAPSPSARTAKEATRDALVAQYGRERESVFEAHLPPPGSPYDGAKVAAFLTALSTFDRAANARAFASGLLTGATPASLAAAGAAVPLRPGAAAALAAAVGKGVPVGVLSVSWSTDLVLGALTTAGVPTPTRGSWPVAPLAAGPGVIVTANDVEAGGESVARRVECADDKAAALASLTANDDNNNSGAVVYVGDAPSDVGALLAADVGIVVGDSATTRRVLTALAIPLAPLATAPADFGRRRKEAAAPPTLYHAAGWDDVAAFLFGGSTAAPPPPPTPPRLLSIAGSDSGGGAGIQADIKTAAALGVYAATALTAVTVQNTRGVAAIHPLPPSTVASQIAAVLDDVGADAVKTGMLGTAEIVAAVADELNLRRARGILPPFVLDPVLVATSGDALAATGVADAVCTLLLPLATVVTPNVAEAAALLGRKESDLFPLAARVAAAADLVSLGAAWALVKGGHADDGASVVDVLHDGVRPRLLRGRRVDTRASHGTGCTLASALASGLARGLSVPAAAVSAKAYVSGVLAASAGVGEALGGGPQWPMNHAFATTDWRRPAAAWPVATPPDYRLYVVTDPALDAAAGRTAAAGVAAAVRGGATIVQVRAKDASPASLVDDAIACVAAAGSSAPVLVNDRVDAALGAGAAGAHVGQSDLPAPAARTALGHGRLLGVSVKTAAQAVAAQAAGADYVGAGAVFPTGTKEASVIGLAGLAAIAAAVHIPVVAIGGINADNAGACIRAGAAGVAVVSAVFGEADVAAAAARVRGAVDAALEEQEEEEDAEAACG